MTSRLRIAAMSRSGTGGALASACEPMSPDSSAAKPRKMMERAVRTPLRTNASAAARTAAVPEALSSAPL
jgi:hypothetical protein